MLLSEAKHTEVEDNGHLCSLIAHHGMAVELNVAA